MTETEKKLELAFRIANNAIYFSDSSDYLPALYQICGAIKPELDPYEEIGKQYYDEN